MPEATPDARASRAVIAAVTLLVCLVVSSLGFGGWLFYRVVSGDPIEPRQTSQLWIVLAAVLTASVTLVGTAVTWDHQRRSRAQVDAAAAAQGLAEAQARQVELERHELERRRDDATWQAESERLRLENESVSRQAREAIASMLGHLRDDTGGYACAASVVGAIHGMLRLAHGTTGVRVLRQAVTDGVVTPLDAMHLLDDLLLRAERERREARGGQEHDQADTGLAARQLGRLGDTQIYAAASTLPLLAPTLHDENARWIDWPAVLTSQTAEQSAPWPRDLPVESKTALILFVGICLGSHPPSWWSRMGVADPLGTLDSAMTDPEVGVLAALVLQRLDHSGFLGAVGLDEEAAEEFRTIYRRCLDTEKFTAPVFGASAVDSTALGWFSQLLDDLGPARPADPESTRRARQTATARRPRGGPTSGVPRLGRLRRVGRLRARSGVTSPR